MAHADADPFDEAMARAGQALADVERRVSGPALDAVKELTAAILEAHRSGLEALLRSLGEEPDGDRSIAALAACPEVSSLLSLHGLHPDPFEKRVRRAIGHANRALGKSSAVELLALEGSIARIYINTSSTDGFELARRLTEDSVAAEAPEVTLEFEPPRVRPAGLVKLRRLEKERKDTS